MKNALIALGSLLATNAMAGGATVPNRIPEPEMWALVGVVAVAIGVARFIRRK